VRSLTMPIESINPATEELIKSYEAISDEEVKVN